MQSLFFKKLIFENADSHKWVDQNIMRICTANFRRVGKFLEIPSFYQKVNSQMCNHKIFCYSYVFLELK